MAALPDEVVEQIIADSELTLITPKTRIDREYIWEKVHAARRDGYSSQEEETLLGEVVLAAAIRDHDGVPVGAIHIAGSLSDWNADVFCKRFSPLAIEAARALSQWNPHQ